MHTQRIQYGAEWPWDVQLSAGFEGDRVFAAYAQIENSHRSILRDRDPIIIERKLRNRGTQPFYHVRIGTRTRVPPRTIYATRFAERAESAWC